MVLISHQYKFIYLKNYKVAGSSVEAFFRQFCMDPTDRILYDFSDKYEETNTSYGIISKSFGMNAIEHKSIIEITEFDKKVAKYRIHSTACHYNIDHKNKTMINKKHLECIHDISPVWFGHKSAFDIKTDIGLKIFDEYIKFCVVRNPYDVIVSSYFWENSPRDFTTFCIDYCNVLYNGYIQNDHFRLFIDNIPCCQYYIRYENIKDDIIKILNHIGITDYNIDDLPYHKSGTDRPLDKSYREYYNNETKELVYSAYKMIFDLFDYKF
jgi:hypothetical protein